MQRVVRSGPVAIEQQCLPLRYAVLHRERAVFEQRRLHGRTRVHKRPCASGDLVGDGRDGVRSVPRSHQVLSVENSDSDVNDDDDINDNGDDDDECVVDAE